MPESIILSIAGFNIKVNFKPTEYVFARETIEKQILSVFSGLISKNYKKIDFMIDFKPARETERIYKEKDRAFYLKVYKIKSGTKAEVYYHASLFQFCSFVLIEVIYKLLNRAGFIMHASAIASGSKSYIFTGSSGAGKSTIAKLLSKDKKFINLADDSLLIKKEKNSYYLYQTPLFDKEVTIKKSSQKYKIARVFFIKKSSQFKADPIFKKKFVLINLTRQIMVDELNRRSQIQNAMKFVSEFDNFQTLYFAKDGQKLLTFFEKDIL